MRIRRTLKNESKQVTVFENDNEIIAFINDLGVVYFGCAEIKTFDNVEDYEEFEKDYKIVTKYPFKKIKSKIVTERENFEVRR